MRCVGASYKNGVTIWSMGKLRISNGNTNA